MNHSLKLLTSNGRFGLIILCLIISVFIFSDCSSNKTTKSRPKAKQKVSRSKAFTLSYTDKHQTLHIGDEFSFNLISKSGAPADSVQLFYKNKPVKLFKVSENSFKTSQQGSLVGNQNYSIKVYYSDSLTENHSLNLLVLPNKKPKDYSFKVVRSFEHDPLAYTQGLLYHKGFLYESTGQKKRSSIRRLNVQTGEILNQKALDPVFFGEGIALVKNEIFMLTYLAQVGFVFDIETFDLIRKFNLQTEEGWGLTSNSENLILSDGSSYIYYYEPEYFGLLKQIQVCDNTQVIEKLNELELTPLGLFANVYGKSYIVLINQETGAIEGKLDLSSLIPESVPNNYDYVLNGIAYNYDKETFYVTGKQWPIMYEIKISTD